MRLPGRPGCMPRQLDSQQGAAAAQTRHDGADWNGHRFGGLSIGEPLDVDEQDALVVATRTVGFPVGHASAQMGWRGLRSRPTWRILCYSAENPPERRALVLVDGVDGEESSTIDYKAVLREGEEACTEDATCSAMDELGVCLCLGKWTVGC